MFSATNRRLSADVQGIMQIRRLLFLSTFLAGCAAVGLAQSPEVAFDVVSIKRNVSDDKNIVINSPGGATFNMINVAMIGVLNTAYNVKNVVNAPDWLTGERYDIIAKAAGQPTSDEVKAMLQTLLKQRLKLAAHIEPRETAVYALVVARPNHPGLKLFMGDCDAIRAERDAAMKSASAKAAADRAGQQPAPPGATSGPPCGYTWSSAIYSGGITLAQLAGMIDWVAGRVVVDRTGLPGRYEFTLRFAPPAAGPGGSEAPEAPPILFTALQEQLGLRLDATRAPIDSLVIDYIERPAEN
jgi:uncharacterized protein (TIGR03435 family)